ncbi:MAG: small nuclear ribonucleoprotein [Candidatus Micrarchaeota archaeon]|nr:MAG: small nuclear ribonucleoprotein [Candidatus Micrarchaeota archaeon]
MEERPRPFDLLNKSIGKNVLVRIKGDVNIRGRMTAFDVHMNIVLEDAEEIEDGEVKAKLGTILVRGGNIVFLSPA